MYHLELFCKEDMSFIPHLFTYSTTCQYQCGLKNFIIYEVEVLYSSYFFCCLNCFIFGNWGLIWINSYTLLI